MQRSVRLFTFESDGARAVERGHHVDALPSVLAGAGPALVPVRLAVGAGEAVLAVAEVRAGKKEDRKKYGKRETCKKIVEVVVSQQV